MLPITPSWAVSLLVGVVCALHTAHNTAIAIGWRAGGCVSGIMGHSIMRELCDHTSLILLAMQGALEKTAADVDYYFTFFGHNLNLADHMHSQR
jgi:hypothetical protein